MSKREFLTKFQPIFFQTIKNSFQQNKVPHAYLIVGPQGESQRKAVDFLSQSLICQEDMLACETCPTCIKIQEKMFIDLVSLDGINETIKKGDIENIQKQFQKTSVEGLGKIYIIENIENSTTESMNALLKILEEPMDKMYAIFTCQNINKVIPTIISRCQVISLKPVSSSYEALIEPMNEEDYLILKNFYEGEKEMIDKAKDERYQGIKQEAIHFIEDYYTRKENALINIQLNLLKNYKEKEDIELFLDLVILLFKDITYNNIQYPIQFIDQKELLDRIQANPDEVVDKIEKLLEIKSKIKSNANTSLLIDSLLYSL